MYETPSPSTPFYRVTRRGTRWPDLLKGHGAFYTSGGRYHNPDQPTVYASDDPLVAVSEFCYYQALEWQEIIGSGLRPTRLSFPLISQHILWCFTLKDPPQLVDLCHDSARQTFGFYPLTLLNPSRVYEATQKLANEVRVKRVAGRLKSPSVRAITAGGSYASQVILFPGTKGIKAEQIWRCGLSIEFTDLSDSHVDELTELVDWSKPRFKLEAGNAGPTLTSVCRETPITWDDWLTLSIRHA